MTDTQWFTFLRGEPLLDEVNFAVSVVAQGKSGSHSTDEVARRGREIYERQLKGQMEPANVGKFLVIDIETGEYEMDEDDLAASMRAYRKKPDGARYGMRIGSATSGTIGNAIMVRRQ